MNHLEKWTIVSFQLTGDYTISIRFKDGRTRLIDFESVIGTGWMEKLKNKAYFSRVILNEGGNLEWPDGQDFNPEALYDWDKFEELYQKDKKKEPNQ